MEGGGRGRKGRRKGGRKGGGRGGRNGNILKEVRTYVSG